MLVIITVLAGAHPSGFAESSPVHGAGGVGWLLGSTPPEWPAHAPAEGPPARGETGRKLSDAASKVEASSKLAPAFSTPLPPFQHPSHALLEKDGYNQMAYTQWKVRCVKDRQVKGAIFKAREEAVLEDNWQLEKSVAPGTTSGNWVTWKLGDLGKGMRGLESWLLHVLS